jgi:hypothetical protein
MGSGSSRKNIRKRQNPIPNSSKTPAGWEKTELRKKAPGWRRREGGVMGLPKRVTGIRAAIRPTNGDGAEVDAQSDLVQTPARTPNIRAIVQELWRRRRFEEVAAIAGKKGEETDKGVKHANNGTSANPPRD